MRARGGARSISDGDGIRLCLRQRRNCRHVVHGICGDDAHEDESLDEALWFAVFVAYPESEVSNVLAITQPERADHVERRLSDTASLIRDVVEAYDQP